MVQPRHHVTTPHGAATTVAELARSQRIDPMPCVDRLVPSKPLLDHDEYVAFLKWQRDLRHSEVA